MFDFFKKDETKNNNTDDTKVSAVSKKVSEKKEHIENTNTETPKEAPKKKGKKDTKRVVLAKARYYKLKTKKEPNLNKMRKSTEGVRFQDVLISPHFTEKAAIASENSVYTFKVQRHATKTSIANAIEAIYSIKPTKVRIVNSPNRPKRVRGSYSITHVGKFKKAYVYLPKGQSIEL